MDRRRTDLAVVALLAVVLLGGAALTWQAAASQPAADGTMGSMMDGSMGTMHGPGPAWYGFGTLVLVAVGGGLYLAVRDGGDASPPADRTDTREDVAADHPERVAPNARTDAPTSGAVSPRQTAEGAANAATTDDGGADPVDGPAATGAGGPLDAAAGRGASDATPAPGDASDATAPERSHDSTAAPEQPPNGTAAPEQTPDERVLDLLPEDERRVLEPVIESPGITQIALRDRSDFSKSKVSQTVSDLEKRGLLARERQGRTYRVYPGDDLTNGD
ncbi:MAG: MarR family transcriptional regulator [Halobacteriales archaeon]